MVSRTVLIFSAHQEVTMTCNKPEHSKDKVWDQHLRWLELINKECESNRRKRLERRRAESVRPDPEDVIRPSA
jgi:hypothetical protein